MINFRKMLDQTPRRFFLVWLAIYYAFTVPGVPLFLMGQFAGLILILIGLGWFVWAVIFMKKWGGREGMNNDG